MATEQIDSPLVDLLRQYKLLQQEYEFEKETFYQQTQRAGIPKRIRQGVCWYPVTAKRGYYNSLNQLVVEIKRDENDETEHNFEYGRPVCFFKFDDAGQLRYFNFAATISYVHEDTMLVVLPNPDALLDEQNARELGVQLYFDGTSYKTMFAALTEVMEAKNNRLSHLREVLLGSIAPGSKGYSGNTPHVAERFSRESRQPCTSSQRSCRRPRSAGNRKNNHARGSRVRNAATGKSSTRVRAKQHRGRLDR